MACWGCPTAAPPFPFPSTPLHSPSLPSLPPSLSPLFPPAAPQGLLVYFIVAICDSGSFGLCWVLLFVTTYYLIVYKLQAEVYFMMVSNGDLQNFKYAGRREGRGVGFWIWGGWGKRG